MVREDTMRTLNNYKDLLNMDVITAFPLTTLPGVFFETLINNIRNELSSYQSFVNKSKKKYLSDLENKLSVAKLTNPVDWEKIKEIEDLITSYNNDTIAAEIEKHSAYEILHSENPSPIFSKLLNANRKDADLTEIKNDLGLPFNNKMEREDFIVNFFEQIYKNNHIDVLPQNCIEEFLGPEICNNRVVRDSKLNAEEVGLLDTPLTADEFRAAVGECRIRSAPGKDGISNLFLKKFWSLLEKGMLSYCEHCFEISELTQNFKTA